MLDRLRMEVADVVATRIYPLDTTTTQEEIQAQAHTQSESAGMDSGGQDSTGKAPDQSYPQDLRWHTKRKEPKDRKVTFPEESAPSLRPSSTTDVQETYYTAPESKS